MTIQELVHDLLACYAGNYPISMPRHIKALLIMDEMRVLPDEVIPVGDEVRFRWHDGAIDWNTENIIPELSRRDVVAGVWPVLVRRFRRKVYSMDYSTVSAIGKWTDVIVEHLKDDLFPRLERLIPSVGYRHPGDYFVWDCGDSVPIAELVMEFDDSGVYTHFDRGGVSVFVRRVTISAPVVRYLLEDLIGVSTIY